MAVQICPDLPEFARICPNSPESAEAGRRGHIPSQIGPKSARNLPGIRPNLDQPPTYRAWDWPRICPKSARNSGEHLPESSGDPQAIHGPAVSGRMRAHSGGFGPIRPNPPESGFGIRANSGESAPIGVFLVASLGIGPKFDRNSPETGN